MRSFRPARGFTLLEVLVVVAIVAIFVALGMLSLGSRSLDDKLEIEARRLHEVLLLAADEAVLQGAELGFVHTPQGYAFLVLKDGKWIPLEDAGVLRARALAQPFYLELQVEGRRAPPQRLDDARVELKPQVLLLSSGDATEFVLDLRAEKYAPYYRLRGDVLGTLELQRRDAS